MIPPIEKWLGMYPLVDHKFWGDFAKDNAISLIKWIKKKPEERIDRVARAPYYDEIEKVLIKHDPGLFMVVKMKREKNDQRKN